jgi:glyoxylase-like metal-dependent hydrolase (beta-lactamase superfamily II)
MSWNTPIPIRLGDVTIFQVVESQMPYGNVFEFLPDSNAEELGEHRDWLHPGIINLDTYQLILTFQSFLIKTPHHRILVDTCVGNEKERPYPEFHMQDWPWLERLQDFGFAPEDIDIVLCTHLHVDHVGWNTRLINGQWVPTFPNAKYLFSKTEFEFWEEEARQDPTSIGEIVLADSILPVIEAGQVVMIDETLDYAIDDAVILLPMPGHTPGNIALEVSSRGAKAVISGDLVHSPIQCKKPHWNTLFCVDPDLSRKTRRRFLETYADKDTLICPVHFPLPSVGHIKSQDDAFEYRFRETE